MPMPKALAPAKPTSHKTTSAAASGQPAQPPPWLSALTALKRYDSGTDRAVLLPLDEAVRAATADATLRRELETQLVKTLAEGLSRVAGEYVCDKLAMIGSDRCVPALAALLGDLVLNTPARTALEAIPGRAAGRALSDALARLDGLPRLGVIHSLGMRRETSSVRLLAALLRQGDVPTRNAAAAALGEIGSVRAARVLREAVAAVLPAVEPALCNALLTCAERLAAEGNMAEAHRLGQLVQQTATAAHIRAAAGRLSGRGPNPN